MQRDLDLLTEEDWIPHFVEQNFDGEWSVVPLRAPAGATHPVKQIYSDPTCENFCDTHHLTNCGYLREIINWFECPVRAVRLMKLARGSTIHEHRDFDLDIESGTARLHIVVVTNPQVEFRLNQELVPMLAGNCYYLRLSEPHSVKNEGTSDRVHMVLDVELNDWLMSQLNEVWDAR